MSDRKEYQAGEFTVICFQNFDHFDIKGAVVLSFVPSGERVGMPGFNMAFPASDWKRFKQEVADWDGPGE